MTRWLLAALLLFSSRAVFAETPSVSPKVDAAARAGRSLTEEKVVTRTSFKTSAAAMGAVMGERAGSLAGRALGCSLGGPGGGEIGEWLGRTLGAALGAILGDCLGGWCHDMGMALRRKTPDPAMVN